MPKPGQHYDAFGHLAFPRKTDDEQVASGAVTSTGEREGDREAMDRSVKRMVDSGETSEQAQRLTRESFVRVDRAMRKDGRR